MKTSPAGRGKRLSPDERLGLLPFVPSHSSAGQGWSGIRVEHFPLQPGSDIVQPPLSGLFLILQGHRSLPCRIEVGEAFYEGDLPPASVTLVPLGSGSRHLWGVDVDSTQFQIEPGLIQKVSVEGFDRDPARLRLPPTCCGYLHPAIQHDLAALRDELLTGGPGGRLCAETLANLLVVHLIRHAGSGPAVRGLTGVLAGTTLRAVTDYVHDHLERNIGLADLAAVAHLSAYHFARLFKQTTGRTPHQFVIEKRVERARRLITEGRLTLAQVAAACGFTDQSGFTKHFKRLVGVTPKRFG